MKPPELSMNGPAITRTSFVINFTQVLAVRRAEFVDFGFVRSVFDSDGVSHKNLV